MNDSKEYKEKKKRFDSMLTVYGRQVVLDLLNDQSIDFYKIHLSETNRNDEKIEAILSLADKKGIPVAYHTKEKLSRISKNAKQDQGVCADIEPKNFSQLSEFAKQCEPFKRVFVLDGINNPQNLGMIIRSAAAGTIDAIIIGETKSTKISPLVIKASAGTFFKIPLFIADDLIESLELLATYGFYRYTLSSVSKQTIYEFNAAHKSAFILGNESEGVSKCVAEKADRSLAIPMQRGVESLNVAMAATVLAFMK